MAGGGGGGTTWIKILGLGLALLTLAHGLVVADANADVMANDLGALIARTERAVNPREVRATRIRRIWSPTTST